MTIDNRTLITLTSEIVSAHVSNNDVKSAEIAEMIEKFFGALQGVGAPAVPAEPEKPKGAISVRASIKPEHLISMIDGKPYKMLRRHITLHGYTPDSYRETFGLPGSYPMVSADYAEKRRDLAVKIGLGRKPGTKVTKPARKPRAVKPRAVARQPAAET